MSSKILFILTIFATIFTANSLVSASGAVPQVQPETIPAVSPQPTRTHSDVEAEILSTTVLIELHFQKYIGVSKIEEVTTSHATVMAGRFLVTHNHFKYSLTHTAGEGEDGYKAISLRRANGPHFIENQPLEIFRVFSADAETLVLEFAGQDGTGLFESLSIPSAHFTAWDSIDFEAGRTEVAQLGWDGDGHSFVAWAEVEAVETGDPVPSLEIDGFPVEGSSGGGVFVNGLHVGNVWARNFEAAPDEEGGRRMYAIIALNQGSIVAFDR